MICVNCPVCGQKQFSDCFPPGERFPCPHCRHEVIVVYEGENLTLKPAQNILEKMEWAHTLWAKGNLSMSPEKLQNLGEFLVKATEMERWPSQTTEELQKRLFEISSLRRLLAEKGLRDQYYAFYQSLLEIYLSFRRENPGK